MGCRALLQKLSEDMNAKCIQACIHTCVFNFMLYSTVISLQVVMAAVDFANKLVALYSKA